MHLQCVATHLACIIVICVDGQIGDCPSGQEWDVSDGRCKLCRVGYYRTAGVQERCVRCMYEDMITSRRGAESEADCDLPLGSRDECPSGTQWISREERCVTCPPDTYRTKGIVYWCVGCPTGTSTAGPGATGPEHCLDVVPQCVPGTYWNTSTVYCESCPVGTYRDYGGFGPCTPCPLHHTTPTIGTPAASACIPLPQPGDLFRLEDCPSGTEPDPGSGSCVECPVHTYRTTGRHVGCTPCPGHTGTHRPGAVGSEVCLPRESLSPDIVTVCPGGTEWRGGPEQGCFPCPRGTYKDSVRRTLCTPCPGDSPTPTQGTVLPVLCDRLTIPEGIGGGIFSPDQCPLETEWTAAPGACVTCSHGYHAAPPPAACVRCPEDRTTARRGDRVCEIWGLPPGISPFFYTDDCPAGSEWSSQARACYACPPGFYRAGGAVGPCQACLQGYTTHSPGSTTRDHCNIPLDPPPRLPQASDGCPSGYEPNDDSVTCRVCVRGTYKPGHGTEACKPCPSGTNGALTTAWQGAVSVDRCIGDLSVARIQPLSILQSAEDEISVEISPASGEQGLVTKITVDGTDCSITDRRLMAGSVRCIAPTSRVARDADVTVELFDGRVLTSPTRLTYRRDPVLTSLGRRRLFVTGGLTVPVEGEHLTSVHAPRLSLTRAGSGQQPSSLSACTLVNSTYMTCSSPDLSHWISRTKRDTDPDLLNPVQARVGFDLDGLRLYQDLEHVLPKHSTINVHGDPVIEEFGGINRTHFISDFEADILFQGRNLNGGAMLADYEITIGLQPCQIQYYEDSFLNCTVAGADQTQQLWTSYAAMVTVGFLTYSPGYIMFIPEFPSLNSSTTPATLTMTTPDKTTSVTDTTTTSTVNTTSDPGGNWTMQITTTPVQETTSVDLSQSSKDKDLDYDMLLPILLALAVLLLLILILLIVYLRRKRQKKAERRRYHHENSSIDDLYKATSSTSYNSQGQSNPDTVQAEKSPGDISSGEVLGFSYDVDRYDAGNRLSDTSLPPLPVDAVFGPDRKIANQRSLALPPDGISVQLRDHTKRQEDKPPSVYVMPQSIIDSLPVTEYQSMYPTVHL